jgi:hypothetical protein
VCVIDRDRHFEVEMIAAHMSNQMYKISGPGLAVTFSTDRCLNTTPPTWMIRIFSIDEASIPKEQLMQLIEEIVRFMAAMLLETEPSAVEARFYSDRSEE